jgi:hypothetical protein
MNIQFSQEFMIATLVLNGALLLVVASMASALWRMRTRQQSKVQALQDDLAALCAGAVGVGERLDRVEEKQRRQTARQEQWELHESLSRSYKQAIQLVNSGADVKEVMSHCGVTQGEAELLANMYRGNSH